MGAASASNASEVVDTATVEDNGTIDLPVPMADGSVACLRLPKKLSQADAERIAAIVHALAVPL